MIKIKIAELAKKHGLNTAYALQKALDMPPTMASRLFKGDFDKIGIGTIEKLCEYFGCQPDAFLEYPFAPVNNTQASNTQISNDVERATQSGNTKLSNNTQASNTQSNKTQTASDNEVWLSTNAVAERLKISRKSVNDYILDGKLPATKGGDIPNHKGNRTHNFINLDDVLIYESVYLS
jgi:DNA-binding Xre family transcriptional regulator